jgi:uncharacterized membrane protein YfcA
MNYIFGVELSVFDWFMLSVIGIVVGIINTLAGSGSLITLPILQIFFGLSPSVANGTNRIGALLQSGIGALAFHKASPASFTHSTGTMIPCILGAIIGAIAATQASDRQMEIVITGLLVFMLIILLVNPNRWIRESAADSAHNRKWSSILTFLGIGFYGGFIQAGVGIFLLAGLVLVANYSLKDANAIKLAIVSFISIPALLVFAMANQIDYGFGFLMAFYQVIGAVIGVYISQRIPNANVWIHRLLVVIVAAFAAKMLGFIG